MCLLLHNTQSTAGSEWNQWALCKAHNWADGFVLSAGDCWLSLTAENNMLIIIVCHFWFGVWQDSLFFLLWWTKCIMFCYAQNELSRFNEHEENNWMTVRSLKVRLKLCSWKEVHHWAVVTLCLVTSVLNSVMWKSKMRTHQMKVI